MGNVLDDLYVVAAGNLHYSVHIAGISKVVNNNDRLCLRSYAPFKVVGIHAEHFVDIAENRHRTEVKRLRNASPVGLRGADYLVPVAKPYAEHCRGKRSGTVAVGNSVLSALPRGKFFLKFFGYVCSRELIVADNVQSGGFVLPGHNGPCKKGIVGIGFHCGLSAQKRKLAHIVYSSCLVIG